MGSVAKNLQRAKIFGRALPINDPSSVNLEIPGKSLVKPDLIGKSDPTENYKTDSFNRSKNLLGYSSANTEELLLPIQHVLDNNPCQPSLALCIFLVLTMFPALTVSVVLTVFTVSVVLTVFTV